MFNLKEEKRKTKNKATIFTFKSGLSQVEFTKRQASLLYSIEDVLLRSLSNIKL